MTLCSSCGGKTRPPSRIPQDYRDKCHVSSPDTCAACQKFKALDEKTCDARDVLDRLLDEREAMASILNQHHDPLTRHLPVELVSRIFENCIPTGKPHRSTIRSTHVCQRWRNTAHKTASLWTGISLGGKMSSLGKDHVLEAWLSRSGDLPLNVYANVYGLDPESDPIYVQYCRSSVALVCRHAHRWKTLNICGDFPILELIAASATSFDQLRTIDLLYVQDWTKTDITLNATPSSLITSTCLREIGIHIDYRGLKTFQGKNNYLVKISRCIELFQEASQLETCSFEFMNDDDKLPQSPVVAQSLRELTVWDPPDTFWDCLTFPSLTKLELVEQVAGWDSIKQCLGRSRCQIQELTICTPLGCEHEIAELLPMMPHLRVLDIKFIGSFPTTELFSLLFQKATSTTQLLAQLTSFTYSSNYLIPWSWPVLFLDLMTTRQEQTLRIFTYRCKGGNAISEITEVVDKDMLGHILTVAARLDFKMIDMSSDDMLHALCQHHGVEFPASSDL